MSVLTNQSAVYLSGSTFRFSVDTDTAGGVLYLSIGQRPEYVENDQNVIKNGFYAEYTLELVPTQGTNTFDVELPVAYFSYGFAQEIFIPRPPATIFVDAVNGDDNGAGTELDPYKTVYIAGKDAVPGDIIEYAAGTYGATYKSDYGSPNWVQWNDIHGTAQQPIVHRAALGAYVAFDAYLSEGTSTPEDGISIATSTHFRWEDISFIAAKKHAIKMQYGCQHHEWLRCSFTDIGQNQIHPTCEALAADYSEVHCGISVDQTTHYLSFKRCYFDRNGRIPMVGCPVNAGHNYAHDHHIYAKGAGTLVENCVFTRWMSGFAIKLDGHFTLDAGLIAGQMYTSVPPINEALGHASIKIRNCTFFDNQHVEEEDKDSCGGATVKFNNRTEMPAGVYEIYTNNNVGDETFWPLPLLSNNLYKDVGSPMGISDDKDTMRFNMQSVSVFGQTALFNSYHHYELSNELYTPGSWQDRPLPSAEAELHCIKVAGVQNELDLDTTFVDETTHDLHITPGSPPKNAGYAPLAATVDFEGTVRSTTAPSIGAYE